MFFLDYYLSKPPLINQLQSNFVELHKRNIQSYIRLFVHQSKCATESPIIIVKQCLCQLDWHVSSVYEENLFTSTHHIYLINQLLDKIKGSILILVLWWCNFFAAITKKYFKSKEDSRMGTTKSNDRHIMLDIGLVDMYWMKTMVLPKYLIMLPSIVTLISTVQSCFIPFVNTFSTQLIFYHGL